MSQNIGDVSTSWKDRPIMQNDKNSTHAWVQYWWLMQMQLAILFLMLSVKKREFSQYSPWVSAYMSVHHSNFAFMNQLAFKDEHTNIGSLEYILSSLCCFQTFQISSSWYLIFQWIVNKQDFQGVSHCIFTKRQDCTTHQDQEEKIRQDIGHNLPLPRKG